ncbi:MAG: outer membrane beta-barrel protein [Fibrobacter sp.]|jgi:hypothetical protein|nr:outer membrane beta-barrel protein [Fibrobacter sp.]
MNFLNKFLTVSLLGCSVVFAQETPAPAPVPVADTAAVVPAPEPAEPVVAPVSAEATPVVIDSNVAPVQEQAAEPEPAPQFLTMSDFKQEQPAKQDTVAKAPVVCPVCPAYKEPESLLRFQFGVHLRLGQISYDDDDYEFSGLNWAAGLAFALPLNDRFVFLKLEPVFSSRTLTDVVDGYSNTTKFFINEYNLELPLLVTFRIPRTFLQFFAGPQITLNLKETIKVTQEGKTLLKIEDGDTSREPLEWGLVLGAGFVIGKHMDLDLRANIGISDVYNDLWISSGSYSSDNWDFLAVGFYMGMSFYL